MKVFISLRDQNKILLDRYFLTVPALEKLKTLNSSGRRAWRLLPRQRTPVLHMKSPVPGNPKRKLLSA